jgi:PqqD family protein of HPr-rel-A system
MTKWRIRAGCKLDLRDWDKEFVIYQFQSGDTHLLDNIAGTALGCLLEGAYPLPALTEEVARRIGQKATSDELAKSIQQSLSDLTRLGIVEHSDA